MPRRPRPNLSGLPLHIPARQQPLDLNDKKFNPALFARLPGDVENDVE